MAKTARLKNSNKAPSPHSRLSRRLATSPSDQLTSLPRPARTRARNILAPTHGAGVGKSAPAATSTSTATAKDQAKAKTVGKILKRKQKLRISRGKERAEAVGAKVARKKGMGRRGVGRNADWDELNGRLGGGEGKRGRVKGKGKGEGWVDGDMDGDMDVDGDGEGDGDGDGDGDGEKEGLENEEPVQMGMEGADVLNAVEEEAEEEIL